MLQVKEHFVDETRGYRYGDSEWYEAFTDDKGKLFRACQKEWGSCVSKVYVDKPDGDSDPIGWVFEKRVEYEDAHRISRKEDKTYIRQVWVTVREVIEE